MPRRTNTDIIRELEIQVALLTEQISGFQKETDRLDRLQQDLIGRLLDEKQTDARQLDELRRDIVVIQEFKSRIETKDHRNWLMWVALVGSVAAFVGNLIVLAIR